MKRHSLAAVALVAALSAMPALGQTERIVERHNAPGERLRPDPPKPKLQQHQTTPVRLRKRRASQTQADRDALALAEQRRMVRRARPQGSSS